MRPEIRIDLITQAPAGFGLAKQGVRATDIATGKFAESFDEYSFYLNRAKAVELLDECLKND